MEHIRSRAPAWEGDVRGGGDAREGVGRETKQKHDPRWCSAGTDACDCLDELQVPTSLWWSQRGQHVRVEHT